jgi:SAM-dependent methyltransferase
MILTKPLRQSDPVHPIVEKLFDAASPQHPARKAEYTMGLQAAFLWGKVGDRWDVGGAGSPFHIMAGAEIIDPTVNHDLRTELDRGTQADAVFCISVIEHVPEYAEFVEDLSRAVRPGGLLFLTMDAWNERPEVPDKAHFHWMRQRIFTKESWKHLAATLHTKGFRLLGEADWDSPIEELEPGWGYGFVSLTMIKEE